MTTAKTIPATIVFPLHISVDRAVDSPAVDEECSSTCSIVTIRCAGDGVCWRGLYPLLILADTQIVIAALGLLWKKFGDSVHYARKGATDSPIWTKRHLELRVRNRRKARGLIVHIIPPRVTCIANDCLFVSLLIRWEHMLIQMQSMIAWISTLGGGYFLCRHLETAVRMARQQRYLALWLGDEKMADRCTLNEAFNYIHAGQFEVALRLIRAVKRSSEQRDDDLTVRMCQSALLFCHRVRTANKHETEHGNRNDTTTDDFQRIRIVQDRSKRSRITA